MGAIANLTAAGALDGARHGKKHQRQAQASADATLALLASIDAQLRLANEHAVALVNQQIATNTLLQRLVNQSR